MTTSQSGINFIKKYESLKTTAYQDACGIWTIGYGHTGTVDGREIKSGIKISGDKALELLEDDIQQKEKYVDKYVKVTLLQGMYDALVSFAFNVGTGAFKESTLLELLNKSLYMDASNELLKWNKGTVNGKKVVLSGLTKRRIAEQKMFLTGFVEKPKTQVTNKTASTENVRWLQWKLGETVDGAWGKNTANAIQNKRLNLGWIATSGYTATENLINALNK